MDASFSGVAHDPLARVRKKTIRRSPTEPERQQAKELSALRLILNILNQFSLPERERIVQHVHLAVNPLPHRMD